MAYRLALPLDLSIIHPVFHVSMLQKYLHDPSHVLTPQTLQLDENMCYEKEPIAIVDRQIKKLHWKEIASIKVIWQNHSTEKVTWEA